MGHDGSCTPVNAVNGTEGMMKHGKSHLIDIKTYQPQQQEQRDSENDKDKPDNNHKNDGSDNNYTIRQNVLSNVDNYGELRAVKCCFPSSR